MIHEERAIEIIHHLSQSNFGYYAGDVRVVEYQCEYQQDSLVMNFYIRRRGLSFTVVFDDDILYYIRIHARAYDDEIDRNDDNDYVFMEDKGRYLDRRIMEEKYQDPDYDDYYEDEGFYSEDEGFYSEDDEYLTILALEERLVGA